MTMMALQMMKGFACLRSAHSRVLCPCQLTCVTHYTRLKYADGVPELRSNFVQSGALNRSTRMLMC